MYRNRILCNILFVICQLLYVKIENKYLAIYLTNSLFTIVAISIGFKMKVDQGAILVSERVTNLTFN